MSVTLIAQAGVEVPEVAWSAFAPELAPTVAALVLLLVAIARGREHLVAGPVAIAGVGLGAYLVTQDLAVPAGVATALGLALPVLVVVFPTRQSLVRVWAAGLALAGALVLTVWQYQAVLVTEAGVFVPQAAMEGAIANDGIALFTRLTVYLTALLVLPIGHGYLRDRRIGLAEVEPLVLLAAVGMAALGSANDLITLFVALELLSLALYVLAGLARRDRRSQEASLKYLVLGTVGSAILLYGMALTYLATGSVDLPSIGVSVGLVTTPRLVAAVGLGMIIVGIAFKVAIAPFHLWVPDVYQGAPTNVTAFMAAATKAAGFAAALRLTLVAFPSLEPLWAPVLAVLAAVTMLYGAYAALVQHDLKRILAYSSVTHAGYAAIGLVAGGDAGLAATLWYLFTYAVGTLGAFGCLVAVERRRRGEVTLADLRGLGRTSPAVAGILGLSLLSLAGIPATVGFVGKLMVFRAGVEAGLTWLVVIGVLSSVVAAFFYLRIAGMMFLEDADEQRPVPVVTTGLSAGVAASGALVLFLGLHPEQLLRLAEHVAVLVR